MIETMMTQKRRGVLQNNGATLAVQLTVMEPHEAEYYRGAEPTFRYWMHVRGAFPLMWDIRIGDLFTDTQNIDPNTNANAVYRVAGVPNRFLQAYAKIPVELYLGTPK